VLQGEALFAGRGTWQLTRLTGAIFQSAKLAFFKFLRACEFCKGETGSRQIWLARGRRTNDCVNASIEWPSAETE
jgi:hypothetical protein